MLAEAALRSSTDEKDRLRHMTRRVLARLPQERELTVLTRELQRARDYYRPRRVEAARWLSHGQTRPSAQLDLVDLAAYTVVANLLFNLDEAVTRE